MTLIFKTWIASVEPMNTNNLSTDLSWLNALGQQTGNGLATDGNGLSWSRLGAPHFMFWLNPKRCQRWNGLQSQSNLTKKGVAYKMSERVTQQ